MPSTPEEVWLQIRKRFDEKRASLDSRLVEILRQRLVRCSKTRPGDDLLHCFAIEGIRACRYKAEWYVRFCCEIRDEAGIPRDEIFNQAVFEHCLTPLFGEFSNFVRRRSRQLRHRPSDEQFAASLSYFAGGLRDLRRAWQQRLGLIHGEDGSDSTEQLGGPYPSLQDVQPTSSGNQRTKRGESQYSQEHRKPGPVGPSAKFVADAGALWIEARKLAEAQGKNVTDDQLLNIARSLDGEGHVPPLGFLTGRAHKALGNFNSRNARSRVGTIETWVDLVRRCRQQKYAPRKAVRSGASQDVKSPMRDGQTIIDGMRTRLRYCANKLQNK